MTIVLRMVDGVPLTAQQERQAWGAAHGGGSGRQLGGRSGFRVGTPSTVLSATSTTWTLGACSAMLDPGAQTNQGMYGWSNDSNVTGTVTAADATYDRKDIVYVQVNDSDMDTSGAKSAPVLYLAGSASASPVAPGLPPRSFLVGTITVPKVGGGSPTVVRNPATYVAAGSPQPVWSQAERDALSAYDGLTVKRMDIEGRPVETWDGTSWRGSGMRHAEYVNNGTFPVTGGAQWDIGTLTLGTPVFNNTFSDTVGTLSGQVRITEAGVYSVHVRVVPDANPGYSWLKLLGNNINPLSEEDRPSGGLYEIDVNRANIYLSPGDTIRGRYFATNSCNIASRLVITKLQG